MTSRGPAWLAVVALGLGGLSSPARAAEVVVGYQLSGTQTLQTILTDNPAALGALTDVLTPTASAARVVALSGAQSNTTVGGNLTFDIATARASHGFLLGATFTQLVPFLAPELGPVQEALSGLQAQATYALRVRGEASLFDLGVGYALGTNGALPTGSDGRTTGGNAGGTAAGANLSGFVVRGITHTLSANGGLTAAFARTDLTLGVAYSYSVNGVFTLAPGALGGQTDPTAAGTALSAFVPTTIHLLTPVATLRREIGRRSTLTSSLRGSLSFPEAVDPDDPLAPAGAALLGPTHSAELGVDYRYRLREDSAIGLRLSGRAGFRVPFASDVALDRAAGVGFDAASYTFELLYADFFPKASLGLEASVGAGQAILVQRTAGYGAGRYDPALTTAPVPIFGLTLTRRFEPIDLMLTASRSLGAGALGGSAAVFEALSFTFRHLTRLPGDRGLTTTLGATATRVRGFDDRAAPATTGALAAIALGGNSDTVGAALGATVNLLEVDRFRLELQASYGFAYNDPNPEDLPVRVQADPFTTHTFLVSVVGAFGRGAIQEQTGSRALEAAFAFAEDPEANADFLDARRGGPIDLRAPAPATPPPPAPAEEDAPPPTREFGDTSWLDALLPKSPPPKEP